MVRLLLKVDRAADGALLHTQDTCELHTVVSSLLTDVEQSHERLGDIYDPGQRESLQLRPRLMTPKFEDIACSIMTSYRRRQRKRQASVALIWFLVGHI